MDGSRLSPYPHLSWLSHRLVLCPPRVFVLHEYASVSHRLLVTEEGDSDFVWTTDGVDVRYRMTDGDLGFFPRDTNTHTLGITASAPYQARELLLPSSHVEGVWEAEDMSRRVALTAVPVFRDATLRAHVLRLLWGGIHGRLAEDVGAEIAARQVVICLAVIAGGRPPHWLKDASVFSPPVMRQIVDRIDAHLGCHASLADVSQGFGLSPSHFARKFQHSTGLSLNRFMNRRRIGISLDLLKTSKGSLAQLSLDLGFCSQSHFTRLFRGLTGLTPHQFRRAHLRMSD